jgi:hypothetical protein
MKIRGDAKAIQLALDLVQHKNKRRHPAGRMASGGRGLDRVGGILERLAGRLTVTSGTARGLFEPNKSRLPLSTKTRLYKIQGTHIHILISSKF